MDISFGYHQQKQLVRQANQKRRKEQARKKKKKKKKKGDSKSTPRFFQKHVDKQELIEKAKQRWSDHDDWIVIASKSKSKYQFVKLSELQKKMESRNLLKRQYNSEQDDADDEINDKFIQNILDRVKRDLVISRNKLNIT